MKLHLPKQLLGAVLTALAATLPATYAAEAWVNFGNGSQGVTEDGKSWNNILGDNANALSGDYQLKEYTDASGSSSAGFSLLLNATAGPWSSGVSTDTIYGKMQKGYLDYQAGSPWSMFIISDDIGATNVTINFYVSGDNNDPNAPITVNGTNYANGTDNVSDASWGTRNNSATNTLGDNNTVTVTGLTGATAVAPKKFGNNAGGRATLSGLSISWDGSSVTKALVLESGETDAAAHLSGVVVSERVYSLTGNADGTSSFAVAAGESLNAVEAAANTVAITSGGTLSIQRLAAKADATLNVNAALASESLFITGAGAVNLNANTTVNGAFFVQDSFSLNNGATLEVKGALGGTGIDNLTGSGTVILNSDALISGNTDTTRDYGFTGTIEMQGGQLAVGSPESGANNNWKVDMDDCTIVLNGGNLRYFGGESKLGDLSVKKNAVYTIHATQTNKSVKHGELSIDSGAKLTIKPNWGSTLDVETLTGAGDLSLEKGGPDPGLVMNVGSANLSGKITLQDLMTLNVGSETSSSTFSQTIENAGTVNLAGAINVTSDGNYTLYTLGESSYSADNGVNGFRTTTGSKYYLVKGQGTTTLAGTVYWDGTAVETTTIESGDEKGFLFTAGTFTDESAYYVNTTVSSDVQNTAKYVLNAEGAQLKIASGSLSNSRIQYTAGAVNVNGNTLLLDTASEDMNTILSTATGSGRIIISQNALYAGSTGGAAAAKPAFTGTWEVTSGTLSIGNNVVNAQQLGWLVDLSGLTAIELNGGNLFYSGGASKLGNISVLKDATLRLHDMPKTDPCPVLNIGSLSIAQDKTLTLRVDWKGSLNIEALTGAGTLKNSDGGSAGGVTSGDGTRLLTVGIGSGFTGKLDLQKGDNTIVIGSGITLNSSQVVNNAQDKTALKSAAIKGTGTYNLGSSTSLGVVSLDSEWKGTVQMSGATLSDTNLNGYGNANSTVQLYNANGSLAAGTVDTKLSLQGDNYNPAIKINTTTGKTVTFANTVSSTGGNGNFVVEATGEGKNTGTDTYVFSGDVSDWTGKFIAASDTNVKYEGNATTISNSICANAGTLNATIGGDQATTVNGDVTNKKWDTSNGTLNLKVTNSSAEGATFTNTVKVNTTTIAAGSKATFNGSSDLGSLTLESGAFIEGAGSLTIGELVLNLESYTQDYENTHTLVTTTGSLTFNGSLVGYTDVKMNNGYIANVTNTGSSLLLTFTQELAPSDSLTTTVLDASFADGMLTLNVDGDITVDTRFVNITGFADGVLADILNLTKGVEDGMVGIKLVDDDQEYPIVGNGENNVGFYGAYYGAGNGQYFVQYIPEPATATLSLLALAGLAARRRRK